MNYRSLCRFAAKSFTLCVCGILHASGAAYADGIVYVDPGASGDRSGRDWANACTDLQTALQNAESGMQIRLAPAVYLPGKSRTDSFIIPKGVSVCGGFQPGSDSLENRNPEKWQAVLSGEIQGDGNPSNNVFHVVRAEAGSILDGVHVRHGFAGGAGLDGMGGGILAVRTADNGAAIVSNCVFRGNFAVQGGAIAVTNTGIHVSGTLFEDNSASEGGAIYARNITEISDGRIMSVDNCVFRRNHASDSGGGAFVYSVADCHIRNSLFLDNSAGQKGGGVMTANCWWAWDRMYRCTFVGNSAGNSGGGIAQHNPGLMLESCDFFDNTAKTGGAMIYYNSSGKLVRDCRFVGNRAAAEGGAFFGHIGGFYGRNLLFAGNTAKVRGGGIFQQFSHAARPAAVITNGIYIGNRAPQGGAIFTHANYAVTNVNAVIWDNDPDGNLSGLAGDTNVCINSIVSGGWTIGSGNTGSAPEMRTAARSVWPASAKYDAKTGLTEVKLPGTERKPDELAGMILRTASKDPKYFMIAGNSAGSASVWGDAARQISSGEPFVIFDCGWKERGWRPEDFNIDINVRKLSETSSALQKKVVFTYKLPVDLHKDGTVHIALRNMDTLKESVKILKAPLEKMGTYSMSAEWKTSDGGLENGWYLPVITIYNADGETIGRYETPAENIEQIYLAGGIKIVSRETAESWAQDIRTWLDELLELEEKAVAAGADCSLPGLMIQAMRETVRQLQSRIDCFEYELIGQNHAYCAAQVPKTKAQLLALIADPDSGVNADIMPRPAGRLSLRDGYFWDGDTPVFMIGHCVFAFLPELEKMRNMGFNLVHVSTAPDSVFGKNKREDGPLRVSDFNKGPLTVMTNFLNECSRLGIKVDLGLTTGSIPGWFFDDHPGAVLKGGSMAGMYNYDIEDPDANEFIKSYLEIAMQQVAGHPAINSIWLANEPGYLNYGERSKALFRKLMLERYGSIEQINEAWGTSYASAEDINPDFSWTQEVSPRQTDYWWFNLNRLTEHFKWQKSIIRRYDPTVPVEVKLNNMQMGWFCPPFNVDQEGVTDMSEIAGMDSGTLNFAKPYYDWLRCLSPEKPMVNLEFKGGGERARVDIWKGAFMGLAGIDIWAWHPKDSFAQAISRTSGLHENALAAYNIQRLLPQVMAFQKMPRSPFVVLYPDPVLPRAGRYFEVHTPAVNIIKDMNYAVDYVTEKRLNAGRLNEYKYDILVLPRAEYARESTVAGVESWIRSGGTAVIIGDSLLKEPSGRDREVPWLAPPQNSVSPIDGVPGCVKFNLGAGTVWKFPDPSILLTQEDIDAIGKNGDKLKEKYYEIMKPWFEAAASVETDPPPLSISGCEALTVPWTAPDGRRVYLTRIVNEIGNKEFDIAPVFNVKMKKGVDLISGEPISDSGSFKMEPYGVRLIEWTPENGSK